MSKLKSTCSSHCDLFYQPTQTEYFELIEPKHTSRIELVNVRMV